MQINVAEELWEAVLSISSLHVFIVKREVCVQVDFTMDEKQGPHLFTTLRKKFFQCKYLSNARQAIPHFQKNACPLCDLNIFAPINPMWDSHYIN